MSTGGLTLVARLAQSVLDGKLHIIRLLELGVKAEYSIAVGFRRQNSHYLTAETWGKG